MPRKLVFCSVTLAFLLAVPCISVRAEERIHSFHSDIEVLEDASLKVTETITVTA